ncbi:MAG TPA: thioredoxin-disulfide reductase [Polyangiaceae bacterium LLY-WYZ-14_1]|jgi:thioredoxin reductase (NADPH)|nr:thioredoxin-disulfide reductase [Polyangiaceae bacterium LLY-WYZ-14_1]
MKTEKVIIVGSGPAGHTAAVYAARANLEPLMIEGMVTGGIPGGQLMITTDVENYPGFPDGIQGPEMMTLFKKQSERFGTRIITADVDRVDFSERPYRLWASNEEYRAHSVIITTGAKAKWLGLENEEKLANRGVSACATCDGFFFKGQHVAVVGGGDTAMEEALYLAGLCASVTVIHRRDELRASKIMQQRAMEHPRIDFLWSTQVTDVLDVAKGTVTGLRLKNLKTGEEYEKPFEGLFIAIGHTPNTAIFGDWLDMDDQGYLLTKPGTVETKLPGVFAAGDCQDKIWRQAVTAAGTGCMAAISAERWLAEHGLS